MKNYEYGILLSWFDCLGDAVVSYETTMLKVFGTKPNGGTKWLFDQEKFFSMVAYFLCIRRVKRNVRFLYLLSSRSYT